MSGGLLYEGFLVSKATTLYVSLADGGSESVTEDDIWRVLGGDVEHTETVLVQTLLVLREYFDVAICAPTVPGADFTLLLRSGKKITVTLATRRWNRFLINWHSPEGRKR